VGPTASGGLAPGRRELTMSPSMRRCIALCVAVVMTVALGCVPAALAQSPKEKATKTEAKKEPIDINTASAQDLQTLKGIGDAYAKKIIENRPYKGKDDLVSRNVIPEATYGKIKDQIIARQPAAKK
jgi:DNA uptake protein ComE-like DNA-binding protein